MTTADNLDPYAAYCAGLYEGEGTVCFWISKQRKNGRCFIYGKISIQISMTDLHPLRMFQEFMDVGTIAGPYDKGPNRKPMYQYNISKYKDVEKVVNLMLPWLSDKRIKQWDKARISYLIYTGEKEYNDNSR